MSKLFRRRLPWIVLGTLISVIFGGVAAFTAEEVYSAYAIISPKTGDAGKGSGMLSSLGSLGRGLPLGLGTGENTLSRMEILLVSRPLVEATILKNNLLPVLFREEWNAEKQAWISADSSQWPTLRRGIEKFRQEVVSVEPDLKKNTLKVWVHLSDPEVASRAASQLLEALAEKLQMDAVADAQINQDFLEKRLDNIVDPRMREKIQDLIAAEIEKAMLISTRSFDVLEKPVPPMVRSKPKRRSMLMLSFAIGLALSFFAVLGHDILARNRSFFRSGEGKPA